MRPLLGIDVGWSLRRRSCALATSSPIVQRRGSSAGPRAFVGQCSLTELLDELRWLATTYREALRSAVLVIDGPVGPEIDAVHDRGVDGAFARGGFHHRAPAYAITHGTGLRLSQVTAQILRSLDEFVAVRPWLGGALPNDGLVVAETNPTPAMALLLPQQDIPSLPSRRQPKSVGGTRIRAKSDWYWRLGGGQYAARLLDDASIAAEVNHERVAGLFALALAWAMAYEAGDGGSVTALGDANGVYIVPSEIDETWREDVCRVGVVYGDVRFSPRQVMPLPAGTGHAGRLDAGNAAPSPRI